MSSLKRQWIPITAVAFVYAAILLVLINACNANSLILYKIEPYAYGSEPLDFFFSIFVSIPFSFYLFLLVKDNYLDYVALRISKKKYLMIHILASLFLCFCMVFLVNLIGVVFSVEIANISQNDFDISLSDYIFGSMQMENPILFGIVWSLHKAFVGTLICLFAQTIALYIKNFFLVLLMPFVYVIIENFITAVLRMSQYSLTTAFALNRLSAKAMSIRNIVIAVFVFIVVIVISGKILKSRYEKK